MIYASALWCTHHGGSIAQLMEKLQAVYVECDAEYKRRIKATAAERGITVARLVKEALDAYFAADGARQTKHSARKSSAPTRYVSLKD
jgi:hypothetical protein